MAHITSPFPHSPLPAAARSVRWSCLLIAAAALQLSGCGGGDSPTQGVSVPGGAASAGADDSEADLAPPAQCATQPNDTPEQLLECMTPAGVRVHLQQLMAIAQANRGTRMAGTAGYDASIAYARKVLSEAGYRVTVQPFKFPLSRIHGSSLGESGQAGADSIPHQVADYSGSADVTALVSRPGAAQGCSAEDFAGFPRGHIALLRRGSCGMTAKVAAALQAGAAGVVMQSPDDGELTGSVPPSTPLDLPVVLVTHSVGEQLVQRALTSLPLHLQTETSRSMATAYNLLAESIGGDPNHVTMVGAHLDSVRAGAGINDNGSGTATLLETARQMARVQPLNRLRFALWGAEEQGLLGSTHYVEQLDADQRAKIDLYLNFDMIASPNHVFYVFGGEGAVDAPPSAGSQRSAQIVKTLEDFYAQRQIPSKRMASGGRSDHKPFADIGIPYGGIFTGAEEIKSREEARLWGGRAGVAFDPCYHRSCDKLSNIGARALDINADAVAHTVLFYAMRRFAG